MTDLLQISPIVHRMPFHWTKIPSRIIVVFIGHVSLISFNLIFKKCLNSTSIHWAPKLCQNCGKLWRVKDGYGLLKLAYIVVKIKTKSKARHRRMYWIISSFKKKIKEHCLDLKKNKKDIINEDDLSPKGSWPLLPKNDCSQLKATSREIVCY